MNLSRAGTDRSLLECRPLVLPCTATRRLHMVPCTAMSCRLLVLLRTATGRVDVNVNLRQCWLLGFTTSYLG